MVEPVECASCKCSAMTSANAPASLSSAPAALALGAAIFIGVLGTIWLIGRG